MADQAPWRSIFCDYEAFHRRLVYLSDEFKFLQSAMPGAIDGSFTDFRPAFRIVQANILAAKAAVDEALRVLDRERDAREVQP